MVTGISVFFIKTGTGDRYQRFQCIFEGGSEEKQFSSDVDDFPSVVNDRRKNTIDAVSKWVNTNGKYISRLVSFEAWVPDAVFTGKRQNQGWTNGFG